MQNYEGDPSAPAPWRESGWITFQPAQYWREQGNELGFNSDSYFFQLNETGTELIDRSIDACSSSTMSNEDIANWLISLHYHNNYRDKHDDHISETYINLQKALRENDLTAVGRLARALFDHCQEIILDSQTTCDEIIGKINSLDRTFPPTSEILREAALTTNKTFTDWQRRNQPQRSNHLPSANKEDDVSPSIALEEDTTAKRVSREEELPASEASQEVQRNEDTRRNWLSKVLGGWGVERAASSQAASTQVTSTVNVHEAEETALDQVSAEEEAVSSSEVFESQDDSAAAEVVSLTSAEDGNETAAVTDSTEHLTVDNDPNTATAVATNSIDGPTVDNDSSTAAAVATNSKEHSIVDVEPFIQFIGTFDNAQPKTLTAAIDLPFLRLLQVLVDLAFKKQEGLCLYNTLKLVTFDTLSVLGPLSKLNGVVGTFLIHEAAKMKDAATNMTKVVNMRQAGMGSIISYLDDKTSGAEDEGESPSVSDEVMAVKEAIYRATHGDYGTEVDEEARRTINNTVSNGQLQMHVNIGYDTSNLITNMLDILFILFLLSELSILDIYEYLSKQDSLMKSLEEFAQAVKPGVVCDVDMKGIDFLFTFAAPALRNGKHRNDAFKITNSLLCSLNKIVSVSNNASAEKKMNDPRKRKFFSKFRQFECQASDGTEDTNAAKYWSGDDDTNSGRRKRSIRNFGNHFCRVVIEECVPPDTFSKSGYTQSFLCLSPSMIGKKCSYIKPELYSKCKDIITTQIIGELKKRFDKKANNTGKRTIFIENEEQCNSLKKLVKIYEALQSD